MNTHDIKRYAVSGDIAYPIHEDPEGDYVTYEDHVAAIEADRKSQYCTVYEEGWKDALEWAKRNRKRRDNDQQPFGYFRPEPFGWTDCAATDEGAIALYERPQAQGEPVLDRADLAFILDELREAGLYRAANLVADAMRAPQPAEPVKEQP